jgi:DnaK suppressor protein
MGQATKLTPQDVARFRERLQAEYERLLAMHSDSLPRRDDEALEEPGDPADFAEEEREVTVSLSSAAADHRRFAQVKRALQKLEEGSYGLSDLSEEPIPLARLEAIPWATANVEELGDEDTAPAGTRDV